MTFIEAIARMEGFGPPANRPTRNNNPGDIEWREGGIAERHGATGGDPRFAIFPTVEQGWMCLRSLFVHNYAGMTVEAAIHKFAPSNENDTNEYIAMVSEWTGLNAWAVLDAGNIG